MSESRATPNQQQSQQELQQESSQQLHQTQDDTVQQTQIEQRLPAPLQATGALWHGYLHAVLSRVQRSQKR